MSAKQAKSLAYVVLLSMALIVVSMALIYKSRILHHTIVHSSVGSSYRDVVQSITGQSSSSHPSTTSGCRNCLNSNQDCSIPNIVNFAYVTPSRNSSLNFSFKDWLCVHSAAFHQNPDVIYIHTNAVYNMPMQVSEKEARTLFRHLYPSYWTYLILTQYPQVQVKFIEVNDTTPLGYKIKRLENLSDFTRTQAMMKYGGIYLDFDSFLLRSVDGLRCTGYRSVVGYQADGRIACGMWLSSPNSSLGVLYSKLQGDAFNGAWDTHAVKLLDIVVQSIMQFDTLQTAGSDGREVLVMYHNAFFPLGWSLKDLKVLYDNDINSTSDVTSEDTIESSLDFDNVQTQLSVDQLQSVESQIRQKLVGYHLPKSSIGNTTLHRATQSKVFDWSKSYAVHGFNSGAKKYFAQGKFAGISKGIPEGYSDGVTIEYILQRKSNFAIAVYPALKDALDKNVVKEELITTW
ncbi:hypothetical protein MP228_011491 [Amoeboaphelidium protococcarum]|nr:hypothetical protein MP228_011491 [Amoeboaphelidium protococcarum]